MPLNCGDVLAIALFSLTLSSGFADVIPISSSQRSGVSGSVFICVHPPECAADSPGDGFDTSFEGSASIGNFFSVEASLADGVSSTRILGGATHAQATVTATNERTLVFDLTSRTVVHLAGSVEVHEEEGIFSIEASANAQVNLTGPNFQFDVACTEDGCFPQTFDTVFTLDPGIYTLTQIADASQSAFGSIDSSFLSASESLTVFDFTAIPEPYWTPLIPLLVMAAFAHVARTSASRIAISRWRSK